MFGALKQAEFCKEASLDTIKISAVKSGSTEEEMSIKRINMKNSVSYTIHILHSWTSSTSHYRLSCLNGKHPAQTILFTDFSKLHIYY
jgi:hypothetical protein